jgi:hypothetical protein
MESGWAILRKDSPMDRGFLLLIAVIRPRGLGIMAFFNDWFFCVYTFGR